MCLLSIENVNVFFKPHLIKLEVSSHQHFHQNKIKTRTISYNTFYLRNFNCLSPKLNIHND